MNLDIETVRMVDAIRKQINSVPLKDIHLYKKGKRVYINRRAREEFEFTGLNNWDFFSDNLRITIIKGYKLIEDKETK